MRTEDMTRQLERQESSMLENYLTQEVFSETNTDVFRGEGLNDKCKLEMLLNMNETAFNMNQNPENRKKTSKVF